MFRRFSDAMALWFVALAVVSFSGLIVEGIAARSMLSLSQEYVKVDPSDAGLFHAPATLIRSVRNSAHYMNLLVSGGSLLVLYTVLFRFALIPRTLSAFGLATVALLIARGFADRTAVPGELLREA